MTQMEFGSYNLMDRLGEGGYSNVYLARDPRGRAVALKILKDAYLDNLRVRRWFTREARLHLTLVHEAIPRCYGLVRFGRRLAIALEYFESRSLRGYSGKEDDLAESLKVLLQIGMALSYLHDRSVVHLDVKPGNILVNSRGEAKLIDFYLAFRCTWLTRFVRRLFRRSVPGSPSYMAPEVIRGRIPDRRADLYSLGVVTYFALTGKLPFAGITFEEILRRQTQSTPISPTKLNPGVPQSLERLIFRLLVKDPGQRLSDVNVYCEELLRTGLLGARQGAYQLGSID